MKISKKYQTIDREEVLLKYLLSLDRDEKNEIIFGTNRYKTVPQFTPEQVIQTLVALQDCGLISIYFYGQPTCETACLITLREAGLTYFEDQELDDESLKDDRRHNYLVQIIAALFTAIVSFILGRITG